MRKRVINALVSAASLPAIPEAHGQEALPVPVREIIFDPHTVAALIFLALALLICIGLASVMLCEWLERKGRS